MALAAFVKSVIPDATPIRLTLVPRRARRRVFPVALVAALVVSMFGVVALTTHMAGEQMRLDRLDRDIVRARNNYDRLRAERARFQSPQFLVDKAKALGMVPGRPTTMAPVPGDIAVLVASGVGKVDADVVASPVSPLGEFGAMKNIAGENP